MRRREGTGRPERPAHEPFRNFCRVAGPIMIVGGFAMIVVGIYDFSAAFGDFDKSPDLFWLCFVGMLVLIGGFWLSVLGYAGAAVRVITAAAAPAAREIAGAIAGGVGVDDRAVVRCRKCEAENDADAKFCKACGAALANVCPACNERNDPDAKFCDNCGGKLG